MKRFYFYFFVFLFHASLSFSAAPSYNTFVINYNRSEYKGQSQNWDVAFDDIGRAYFGNGAGVLEFDGEDWELYQHHSKTAIRALYFDKESKRLYSGCYEDFGYWKRDDFGVLRYYSLGIYLKDYHFSGERIWSIEKSGKEILFQSFPSLFVYNTETNQVHYIKTTGDLLFLGKIKDVVYTRIRGKGICSYEKGKFTVVDSSAFAKEATLRFYLPYNNGLLVGDGKTGLHLIAKGISRKWDCEANQILSSKDVNTGVAIGKDSYAIGTLSAGLYIISHEGKILNHIDRQSKLENNTVLGLGMDHSGDLWLAMDNGLSHVELNSDVKYKIDVEHAPSAIYSVIKHKGYVYVGTNNGLLYSKFNKDLMQLDFRDLKPMKGISGHIWKLEVLKGELICSSNDGIYTIVADHQIPLSEAAGGTDFEILRLDGVEWLIESTYYKIRVFKRINNQWVFSHFVDGFEGSCRFIEIDNEGYIWISHEVKGLNRLKLSDDLKRVVSNKYIGLDAGLPTEYHLNVFKLNSRVVVTTGGDIYTYDDLKDRMVPFEKLNNILGRFKKAVNIVNVDKNHFWVIADNEAAYMRNIADSIEIVKAFTLNKEFAFPDKYQNISVNKDASVLCLENGFAILPNKLPINGVHQALSITRITSGKRGVDNKGKLLPLTSEEDIELMPRDNSIEFTLSCVNFSPNRVSYQYRIPGLIDQWLDSDTKNVNNISDIPDGEYEYQARVIFSDGAISNVVIYTFTVLPRWYASKTGILIIILFLLISMSLLIVFNKRILAKQTYQLEKKHKDELLQSESTIQQLKNDVLKKELENLQGKLSVSANALVEKDISINNIKSELEKVYHKLEGRLPHRDFDKLLHVINKQLTPKKDRLAFEQHFAVSQSGFYDKMREEFPKLTPADLRLCSLLKMNMNSKEISKLLGITVRSVEVSRYRLRKKMGLKPEDNLIKEIMKY
ncbi:helix-turn-helix and ligand-binding sensor domain-containing protein [Ancylomarina longa]|uniref:HTH luxR-type domain-containing protein n=1 Tax=Ancylomarina longa TaxID=2487017 RepID=A0A434AUX2_9BACT|nr:hypothetical protein [Ancylomarina longa]RUT78268.1 hypothetical protein DLK05_09340 [Ancylomarina longa]